MFLVNDIRFSYMFQCSNWSNKFYFFELAFVSHFLKQWCSFSVQNRGENVLKCKILEFYLLLYRGTQDDSLDCSSKPTLGGQEGVPWTLVFPSRDIEKLSFRVCQVFHIWRSLMTPREEIGGSRGFKRPFSVPWRSLITIVKHTLHIRK